MDKDLKIIYGVWILAVVSVIFFVSILALDTGATSPGTMADDDTVGDDAWTNPDYAKESDDNRSLVSWSFPSVPVYTHYLKATNFSFDVSGTIDGIKVEIERSERAGGTAKDWYVNIVKSDDSYGSENKADTETAWGSDEYITYGGVDDLWNESWDDTDINNANFGVGIAAIGTAGAFITPAVDHIRITVYYTEEAPEDTCTCAGLNEDWEINMSDYCNITDACDLGTGTLSFTGSGVTRCNASVDTTNMGDPGSSGILYIQDSCLITID